MLEKKLTQFVPLRPEHLVVLSVAGAPFSTPRDGSLLMYVLIISLAMRIAPPASMLRRWWYLATTKLHHTTSLDDSAFAVSHFFKTAYWFFVAESQRHVTEFIGPDDFPPALKFHIRTSAFGLVHCFINSRRIHLEFDVNPKLFSVIWPHELKNVHV